MSRTNEQANRFYLEAKARYAAFAPTHFIRRRFSFDLWGPSFEWRSDTDADRERTLHAVESGDGGA